jgi:hypothetical protein
MSILQSLRKMLRRKNELAEELESHLRMAVADRVARGESSEEAHKSVLREFGNLLSAHLGDDFRGISPAVYRRFLRVWTAST